MNPEDTKRLRDETVDLFYHGYDAYMTHAFPEDELKPLSCGPLTRNPDDETHFDLNDALGNYSLTLVDSLSTLAIFASSARSFTAMRDPLRDFEDGIAHMVSLYGDGSQSATGQGHRSRGFDLDSKVQVFETVIRGVGGLLSAHLFAVGELPIRNYKPFPTNVTFPERHKNPIQFSNGFVYNGQLLRLAHDLALRLLPAFYTPTGLPYPRVNLRHGVPHYPNSPVNQNAQNGQCSADRSKSKEIIETCSAGAGSLTLEFSLLSRLTGDERFETLAKTAFDAVWRRRSNIGLVGSAIDPETGQWAMSYTGIGAGVDSFFEYALKSHVLLSSHNSGANTSAGQYTDGYFLSVWQDAHSQIKRHLYRGPAFQHAHYIQGDLYTGGVRGFWIDSLSAFYPGLLTLGGEVEEAVETHLLYAALWTRYSALPERWNIASSTIEGGLRWWGGRPEFIESTWYLYRATKDPWYLRVGEMVLQDIKERCWTPCGWAGLEDVRNGEPKDRMESFFLGETAKYLFLLYDPDHPLNHLEAPWVFTTEGHPLIMPKKRPGTHPTKRQPEQNPPTVQTCPVAAPPQAFGSSNVASRPDFFHASGLARLHLVPALAGPSNATLESSHWDPNMTSAFKRSRNRLTSYPWTVPTAEVPLNGYSARMETRSTFDLSFPTLVNTVSGALTLRRTPEGIMIGSLSGLKIGMIKEPEPVYGPSGWITTKESFRVYSVGHLSLGRDEKVLISADTISDLNPTDQYFTRHRDISGLDIVIDAGSSSAQAEPIDIRSQNVFSRIQSRVSQIQSGQGLIDVQNATMSRLLDQISAALQQQLSLEDLVGPPEPAQKAAAPTSERRLLYASAATGAGAGPLPDVVDSSTTSDNFLIWDTIHITDESCDAVLPASVPKENQVLVIKRGGCTFSEKVHNIPSYAPSPTSLKLVIMVSDTFGELEGAVIRPALDEIQYTPGGVVRPNQIPVVMVEGGAETLVMFKSAGGVGIKRRYHFSTQGVSIGNLFVI